MSKSFRLKQAAWFKDIEQEFVVPDAFELDIIGPHDAPPMNEEAMINAIRRPFGPSLTEMASGKKRIVFVVDDLGRPTPAHDIIPHLLELLFQAGVGRNNISFVIATGSHRQLSHEDLDRKLGKDIVASYEVKSHDAFNSPTVHLGVLENGFPCIANKEVAEADLIVGIGCVIPHACHGFGGGAKLFCPGIAGMESIVTMHGFTPKRGRVVMDVPAELWDMRSISEAFIAKLPPIFLVNVVVNSRRDICALYAGNVNDVFAVAREKAFETYKTEIDTKKSTEYDVVLINAYPLDSDPVQSAKSPWVKKFFPNAIQVHINSSADGIDYHGWKVFRRSSWLTLIVMSIAEGFTFPFVPRFLRYLSGQFFFRSMRKLTVRYLVNRSEADFTHYMMHRTPESNFSKKIQNGTLANRARQPWIYSEHFSHAEFAKKYSNGTLLRTWDQVVRAISHYYPKAKIAVVTCAPVQIPVSRNSKIEV